VNVPVVGAAIVVLAAAVFFVVGWGRWRRSVRLADTPTVPPSAVPFGRAECAGRAVVPQGWSTVGRRPSVWYRFRLQEYHRDSDGDGDWRTRVEARSTRRFFLVDDRGAVLVDPDDATIDAVTEEARDLDTLTVHVLAKATESVVASPGIDGDRPIGSLRGRWRVLEEFLPVGGTVTALGPVLPDPGDVSVPVFRRDPERRGSTGELYIGHGAAHEVEARNRRGGRLVLVTPLAAGAGVGVLGAMRGAPAVVGVLVAVPWYLPLAVRWALDRYNRIVFTANQVEACWSMVDVALARRATLVPQLVATVEAAFAHEASVQEALAASRWDGRQRTELDGSVAAQAASVEVCPRLAALAERYPSLTSNENALELQRQLAEVEHRIASARTVYNDAVALLLDRMQQFPGSLFAGRFRGRRSTYWKV
jgi:LemA protein